MRDPMTLGARITGLVLIAAATLSRSAEIVVSRAGPESEPVPAYTLVRCACENSPEGGDWLLWKVRHARDLTVRVDVQEYDEAQRIVWVAPPGRYLVEAMGSIGGKPVWIDQVVEIAGPGPQPGPEPPPGPQPPPNPPAPDLPDGKYKLARFSFDLAAGVAAPHRPLAAQLADGLERIANQIRGDGAGSRSIETLDEAQREVGDHFRAVLGATDSPAYQAWAPWLKGWSDRVLTLGPSWPDDVEAVYRETATGLGAVR